MADKGGRGRKEKLVHLNALRAFEAAARHLSFAAAADELHVTPPAISLQIRALEDYLGAPLFLRTKAGVALTPAARDAYPDIRDGLAKLASGLGRLRDTRPDRAVTLTVAPSFAAKWLLPRIEAFHARHPDLELRLDTSGRLADFASEGVDIGVRYGLGGYPGLVAEKLVGEDLFPVCSPALLARAGGTFDLARLATMPLIHDGTIDFDPAYPTWRDWFEARGIADADMSRGLRMNSSLLAIQAALDGQGVALARSVLVERDVQAGRLVRPLAGSEQTQCAYFVVYPKGALDQPRVRAVRDWLFAEMQSTSAA